MAIFVTSFTAKHLIMLKITFLAQLSQNQPLLLPMYSSINNSRYAGELKIASGKCRVLHPLLPFNVHTKYIVKGNFGASNILNLKDFSHVAVYLHFLVCQFCTLLSLSHIFSKVQFIVVVVLPPNWALVLKCTHFGCHCIWSVFLKDFMNIHRIFKKDLWRFGN